MKKIAIALAATSALMLTTGAQAQAAKASPWYGEVGYTSLKYTDGAVDLKPAALRGIVGYGFHPNFAVEGMLGFGIKDDTVNAGGVAIDVKVERALGVFLKPRFNATPELELFARVGFADFKVKASAGGASASSSDSDTAYGVGLNYKLTSSVSLGLDYMRYYSKDGEKVSGYTLGVGFSF